MMGKIIKGWPYLLKRILFICLTLAPLIYLITMISNYFIEAPYWDQWDFVPLLEKASVRNLTISDLWAQHNEHRLIFPKALMVSLAQISNWNIYWELIASLVMAFSTFFFISLRLSQNYRMLTGRKIVWLIPGLAALIFSLNQAEGWLWGWNLQIFMNVFFIVGSILLLTGREITWLKFFASAAAAIGGSFSYASGLLVWPIGIFLLLSRVSESKSKKFLFSFIWIFLGILIFFIYFQRYKMPSHHPPLSALFKSPWRFIQYALAYLGAPLLPTEGNPSAAMILGSSGLILFILLSWELIKQGRTRRQHLNFYFGLFLYSFGAALMTSGGRAGFELIQAMSSRYITISQLFWVVIFVFLYLSLSFLKKQKAYIYFILFGAFFLLLHSSYNSSFFFAERYRWLAPAQQELFVLSNEGLLKRLYPNLGLLNMVEVKERVAFLKRQKYSIFRRSSKSAALKDDLPYLSPTSRVN